MRPILLSIVAATGLALATGACSNKEAAQPTEGVGTGVNWTAVGGAADEASYSQLEQITTENAGELGLQWSLELPDEVTLEAAPLAVDGTLYFPGSYAAVYAVDGKTGKLKWKYDPKTWEVNPAKMHFSFGANRGVAYEDGRIFVAALDCRLIALDAETGKELWVKESTPKNSYNICTGAPRTMNGKVIIGNGGADFGARGFVTAFDTKTGQQRWRFYTVPGTPQQNRGDEAMEKAAETWSENFWKNTGGGGTVWNGMTFDAEMNRIYIGVGNAGPYDAEVRSPGGGDNLYTASIVALDADSGEYIWHYQENPRETWDYKATPNMIMATLKIDGIPRSVLMHAPTNGFLYVIDRKTGKIISAGKTTEISWAEGIDLETGRPIEKPDIRYETGETVIWPGTAGGHNWQPMSYNPKLGLVYIPIQQLGARFKRVTEDDQPTDDAFNVINLLTEAVIQKPGDGHGFLVAWDPVAQKEQWRIKHEHLWNGGTLTTAGGLVFQGTAEGLFNAYDGNSGERLWRFDAQLGIVGAPMTFSVDGKQYVSILVGYGGTTAAFGKYMDVGWKYGAQKRRLLTFALGAKGELPESAGPTYTIAALDDPELELDPADIAAGRTLSVRCAACHGVGMHSTGTPGPDLRESAMALQLDTLSDLLKTGALLERGMPRFEMLSDDEIRQIHAYIRKRARDALDKGDGEEETAPRPLL
ncbi:MAG: PQQ-dependent dehydrogenase, methanol/ethanol family [Novosphingobium sp.]|nr:PQQ-dependent dehydrogenase, methanol/ethanol family [Novosphingobium sp.]